MRRSFMAAGSLLLATVCARGAVTSAPWGKTASGQPVQIFTLTDPDLTVRITTYGARLVSVEAPDRSGTKADVVLGFKDVAGYEKNKGYIGSVVGRYGNRIAGGRFTLDGKAYSIPKNDHNLNSLHGGTEGFSARVWTAQMLPDGVELTLVSPDGDQGFPGKLTAHIRYTLQGKSLHLAYSATTDKPTVLNITNHSYFNLGGENSGTILGETMMLDADRYTPVDAGLIPTSDLPSVAGTPFDFRKPVAIGARIQATDPQLKIAGGYDHNFVLNGKMGVLHLAAKAVDPKSGRSLTVTTTEPGVQFYSGNFLDGADTGISGLAYARNAAFCLETQHFPDSPNHPAFPSTVLRPGQTMHSTTVFTFGVER